MKTAPVYVEPTNRVFQLNHAEQVIEFSKMTVKEFKLFGKALDILMATGMDQLMAIEILLVALKNKKNRV